MSDMEEEGSRRSYGKPYTAKHPVPTIHGYKEHKNQIEQQEQRADYAISDENQGKNEQSQSKPRKAYGAVKAIAKGEDQQDGNDQQPYPSSSRNDPGRPMRSDRTASNDHDDKGSLSSIPGQDLKDNRDGSGHDGMDKSHQQKSASEAAASHLDPKQKRKDMKKIKRHGGGREVTDPVTHLPVMMRDMTDRDLTTTPENEPGAGTTHRNTTGVVDKSSSELGAEQKELDRVNAGMRKLFPPPHFEDTKNEMARVYRIAIGTGLTIISVLALLALLVISMLQPGHGERRTWSLGYGLGGNVSWSWMWIAITLAVTTAIALGVVFVVSSWLSKKVESIFDDETWDADRNEENKTIESDVELPESTAWLNSLLSSVWPLVNPDLLSSLADTLEDVMQASLPKVVRMVSVDDMGQGSESFRILGIRWLPTGAAGQSVDTHGNLKSAKSNDRAAPGEGQIEDGEKDDQAQKSKEERSSSSAQEEEAMREGMEAEEGDFVNLELAFAYRARSSGKSITSKAKNAHLYLKFYLPGGIAVPVWVELKGMIGIMRLRLQLTPDPPFFELCTLTFLGQPRANLSCVPLSKHSLNLMDVPLLSSFVQSSIDAALAEYVAPKSLTLNLKDMLVGDDFKKDTSARGVIMVHVKSARDFKNGDGGIGPIQGSSDSYVTVAWGKFGKPLASTRIIVDEQRPVWNEWAFILVTAEEINADETLRLQLWDSDKFTADDDLGRVELTLKEIMHGSKTRNKMHDREDDLHAEDPDESMPGSLTWSVGYFEKAHIQQRQLDQQTVDPNIRSLDALKQQVSEGAKWKLREADTDRDQQKELRQQTVQDYKEKENDMVISAPPPEDLHSGIVSIQIHNITGLETAKLNKKSNGKDEDREDEAEQSDELPDSYCTIILNHQKIYRTRTKPKNAKPFFNAGTERFVRDWKTAELIVSVRDAREHEEDPLLGIVYLPLRRVFERRSQVMETYPLAGGIGYGRARISLVWRSVELRLPSELAGWDYGTVEVRVPLRLKRDNDSLRDCRIKLHTKLGRVKLKRDGERNGEWKPKRSTDVEGSVFLGVTKRYATPLVVEFRKSHLGPDSSPAFGVFWLCDVPDEEERTVTVKVWKGGKENLKNATACYGYAGLEEGEQPIGEIDLTVKFWRGLSGYHKKYANKARNSAVKDVMEVLDTIADEKMGIDEGEAGDNTSSSSDSDSDTDSDYEKLYGDDNRMKKHNDKRSREDAQKRRMLRKAGNNSSNSGSDGDSDGNFKGKSKKNPLKKMTDRVLSGDQDCNEDGSRGLRAQVQDYKQHHKSLHRKHRGVMQWKGARTLDWIGNKAKHGKGKLEGVFEHRDKDQGIETEV